MKIATCLCLLLLAGCQATSFQTPPLGAEADCDPDLVGRWVSVTDAGQPNDELRLDIDAACALAVADFDKGQLRVISQDWYWDSSAPGTLTVLDASQPGQLKQRAQLVKIHLGNGIVPVIMTLRAPDRHA